MNSATINLEGKTQDFILNAKNFSTGSRGFMGMGKIELPNGKKYQCNLLIVEIGSKPQEKKVK